MEKVISINMTIKEFQNLIRESIIFNEPIISESSEDEIMNQKSAADFLGISQTTIIKWKKEGKIPYEQAPGSSKVRFYKSQLLAAVRQNKHLLQPARN